MKGSEFDRKSNDVSISRVLFATSLILLLFCVLLELQIIPGANLTWIIWSVALTLFTGSAIRLWCAHTQRSPSMLHVILQVAVVVLFTVIWLATGHGFKDKEIIYFAGLFLAVAMAGVLRFNQQGEEKKEPPADPPS